MRHQTILKNPFFYLSVVLFGVLVFQIAQIVSGAGWQEPSFPPPGGQPYPPLDSGPFGQTKMRDVNRPKMGSAAIFSIPDFLVRGFF